MNQYHIYEVIGQGKHSTVYKGRRKKNIQYYAVKSVEKSEKARVLQEVRTMHGLRHNNILKFFAWYETTNHLWLILEYCVGGDLVALLRQDMRLPESSIHDFGRDLVTALQALHSAAIIYCDLKPSNLLLDENGRIKLGGFGLSRRLADINKSPTVQQLPPAKRGTPCYMAPELFQAGSVHSSASDLWALGCVMYECAAGHPPFVSASFSQLVNDILTADPPELPGASPEFTDLVTRLLDKNPATRIAWPEMRSHPFWQGLLPELPLPEEPMLEAFIQQHGLRGLPLPHPHTPVQNGSAHSSGNGHASLRESIDVSRLSLIVRSNLEKDVEAGAEYCAASGAGAARGDVQLHHPDAELDFEERPAAQEGTDGAASDTSEDASMYSSAIDESAASAVSSGGASPSRSGNEQNTAVHDNIVSGLERLTVAAQVLDSRPAIGGSINGAGSPAALPTRFSLAAAPAAQPQLAAYSPIRRPAPIVQEANKPLVHSIASAPTLPDVVAAVAPSLSGSAAAGRLAPAAPTAEDLIWHASDAAVKPIVGNRRIERPQEPAWDPRQLPFAPLTLPEMLAADQLQLEGFLTEIYRVLGGTAPVKDKVSVLGYFESLCTDTKAANVLVNSSLSALLVRLLRAARAPALRVRLAAALGLLVRHATHIADELAATGIVEALAEALRDKAERVRRRAAATLGELLFYVASQQPQAGRPSPWHVPSVTITMVCRLLKPGEDEIAQHYAVKTIENVVSQGGEWAARFGSSEVLYSLVQIYHSGRGGENLKAAAADTLARLLHHQPTLITPFVDKHGLQLLLAGLNDGNARVQAACVNITCMVLSTPDMAIPARTSLQEERTLLPSLAAMMDHILPALRAKALVALTLLGRGSPAWLGGAFVPARLPQHLDRLVRDGDGYVQAALAAFAAGVAAAVPGVMKQVTSSLNDPTAQRHLSSQGGGAGASGSRAAAAAQLVPFPLVAHALSCAALRPLLATEALINDLTTCLRLTAGAKSGPVGDFKVTLLAAAEALCLEPGLPATYPAAVLAGLLPQLAVLVASAAESSDTRFQALRLLCDVTLTCLMELSDDGPAADGGSELKGQAHELVARHVLPLAPVLLSDGDPMPLYGLKLLAALLDRNPAWVVDVERLGLTPRFFEFLSLEHANNNVHNIRLCRAVVASGCQLASALRTMRVAGKVAAVLAYAAENGVEPFLEPALELAAALIDRDARLAASGVPDAGVETEALLPALPACLQLSASPDAEVAPLAAKCVSGLVGIFPQGTAGPLLAGEGPQQLAAALQRLTAHLDGTAAQQLLTALVAACRAALAFAPQRLGVSQAALSQLQVVVAELAPGSQQATAAVRALAALAAPVAM